MAAISGTENPQKVDALGQQRLPGGFGSCTRLGDCAGDNVRRAR